MNKNKYVENLSQIISLKNMGEDYASNKSYKYVKKNLPKKLFKYRDLTKEYHFDMIENEYLYITPFNKFDDFFEGKILKNCENNPNIELKKESIKAILNVFVKNIKPIDISDLFYPNGEIKKKNLSQIFINENIDVWLADKLSNALKSFLDDIKFENADFLTKKFSEVIENVDKGAFCFAGSKNNQVIWELYGGNYEGCCIEYDISKLNDEIKLDICPCLYQKRFKSMQYVYELIALCFLKKSFNSYNLPGKLNCRISEILYKFMLTKNREWEFIDEWKLISNKLNNKILCKNCIKAIYVGKDTPEAKVNRLVLIAQKMNIKIYKQQVNFNKLSFDWVELK